MRKFQRLVYAHYAKYGRALAWRNTHNPYHILVSEIMLQQTQVSRVLVKYPQFIRRFPTIEKLAKASLGDIMFVWQGLGYNRRALALKKIAETIVSDYHGKVPSDRKVLRGLPGIGEATSGALCAFAFNLPEVFVETNIRSVFIHHFFRDRHNVSDAELIPYIDKTLDRKNPRKWYYALMDYGVSLKGKLANPSRKSLHHRRQSTFKGSDRQIRGAIIRVLVARTRISEQALFEKLDFEKDRVKRAVEALKNEGLLKQEGRFYRI